MAVTASREEVVDYLAVSTNCGENQRRSTAAVRLLDASSTSLVNNELCSRQ